jgi:hypothetical protein
MRLVSALLLALALACSRGGSTGSWLTDPGVAGHDRYFPLSGTPHDPSAPGTTVSCDACHPGNTFAQFDCTTCHTAATTDPLHAGVAGYAHTSDACFACHRSGGAAPADHDTRFFPRGTGTPHAGMSCTSCHTDLTHPADPANFACASCHAGIAGFAGKHDPIGGVSILTVRTSCTSATTLSFTSPDCLRCHADSQVNRVASHSAGATALGNATHQAAGCLTCHVAMRTDKPFGADFDKSGAGQGSPGCATCHNGGCGGNNN